MYTLFSKLFLIIILMHTVLFSKEINLDDIISSATKIDKQLFILFHKTGCGYCDLMLDSTIDDDKVKQFIDNNFIYLYLNIHNKDTILYKQFKGSIHNFAKSIGYDFYPTSIFFDEKHKVVHTVVGYRDEKVFYSILNYISSREYKKVKFEKFKSDFEFNQEF